MRKRTFTSLLTLNPPPPPFSFSESTPSKSSGGTRGAIDPNSLNAILQTRGEDGQPAGRVCAALLRAAAAALLLFDEVDDEDEDEDDLGERSRAPSMPNRPRP